MTSQDPSDVITALRTALEVQDDEEKEVTDDATLILP